MKKSLILALPAMLLATSCVDTLDDYNVDPKRASVVPGQTLVSNAERSLARILVSSSVNNNTFRFFVQSWAATTYADESRYELNTRNIPQNFWSPLYRDVLRDLKEAKSLITADITISNPKVKANRLAIIEVLEVYTWATLVDTYGDVPYTEALDFSKPQPKYDDDAAIYADIITRLNAAIGQMDATAAGYATGASSADLINNGNMALWVKFANSLKLRLALTIADVDGAKAKTMAEETAGKTLTANADNIDLTFLTFPNSNPIFEDLIRSGRKDFVASATLVDKMNSLTDPRRDDFFKPLVGTGTATVPAVFKGGVNGNANAYASFSAPGTKLEVQGAPAVLMSYAQVKFMLADATSRGFNMGGTLTAEDHYNAGVTASILEWGGTAAEATAYLAQPGVKFTNAASGATNKEKIGVQEWIALYNQPVDAYREWRRLDSPKLTKANLARTEIPLRLTYPIIEQNLNTGSYGAAASAIGGDNVGTKIFWDKL
ncbi:SusD/RagB family nutrient-binding outer membrane lipoprotein [Hymenobacter fastidiosus]|uniref:SusD/RagB family nutrient-binding outer membrane lipoprotein n=1 Tax=Hymenobacter fastidiosus TaxID=486264 RepID=A0ABP7RMI9_9BACT